MQFALNVKTNSLAWLSFPVMLLLGAAGAYMLTQTAHNPLIGYGLLTAAFVIPILFWATGQYETRLIINDIGIQDERLGVGMIPWDEIAEARIERKYNNNFLCLKLKSPEKFLNRLPPQKRSRIEANHELGFRHFNVSISGVNIDDIDLLELVRSKSAGSRHSSNM